jgi:hypothetical protein
MSDAVLDEPYNERQRTGVCISGWKSCVASAVMTSVMSGSVIRELPNRADYQEVAAEVKIVALANPAVLPGAHRGRTGVAAARRN